MHEPLQITWARLAMQLQYSNTTEQSQCYLSAQVMKNAQYVRHAEKGSVVHFAASDSNTLYLNKWHKT